MKQLILPLTLTTPPLSRAYLSAGYYMGQTAHVELDVTNNPGGLTSTLSQRPGTTVPRGVMKLYIDPLAEACCCQWLMVWSPGCKQASTVPEHDSGADAPVPSCD